MVEKTVVVGLEKGLEARPVAVLVQAASKYESTVYIVSGEKKVNAKSIMGMMGIGLTCGDNVTIIAEGSDEEAAVEDIVGHLQT
jgi:catabolite repression HPr-like protein